MTERTAVEWRCRRKGHLYARLVVTASGRHEVEIPATTYGDVGSEPGTVRDRRHVEVQRFPLTGEPFWGLEVMCACRHARFYSQHEAELQLAAWRESGSPARPRVAYLDTPA